MFRRLALWLTMFLLIAMAAACSSTTPAPQAAPPTATAGSPSTSPTATLAPAAPTNTATSAELAPTAEPPQPTETSTSTATFTPTPKPRVPAGTVRPKQTAAPLSVTYQVIEIKRVSDIQAALVLKVIATGGSGGYRYYHDDIQQPSATFNIAGTCGKPFVHTIKVISGDGQTVALPYHVNGVCPTPTP
jgi:cytoskeletal protein RodZ